MRRELPPQPHLDHLKKQAKDLLADHKRGSAEAMARIRTALPAFAARSDAEVARANFALHDAQSAIAREYGFRSWSELRTEVAKRRAAAFPESLVRMLMSGHPNAPLGDAVIEAVREAWPSDSADRSIELPALLPLVAVRNTLLVPGAVAPLHIGRPTSLAAIAAAAEASPPTLALFSQRDPAQEEVHIEALHPVGVQALLCRRLPAEQGQELVVVRGLRWIRAEGLELAGAGKHAVVHVSPMEVDDTDPAGEVPPLFQALRERARKLARALPEPDTAVALVDAIDDPEALANLVVVNLPCSVEDKARYASAPRLAERLALAVGIADAALAPP